MAIMYEHPLVDNVASTYHVDTPDATEYLSKDIVMVEEAIEVYMQAFYQKFQSKEGRRHRKRSLQMFLQYLTVQGHSLKIADLALADGQGFLDSLTNHFNGTPLTANQKLRYRYALRSFSRFLHDLGLIEEHVFFLVRIEH